MGVYESSGHADATSQYLNPPCQTEPGGATIGSVVAGMVLGAAAEWVVTFLFVPLWVVVTERRP